MGNGRGNEGVGKGDSVRGSIALGQSRYKLQRAVFIIVFDGYRKGVFRAVIDVLPEGIGSVAVVGGAVGKDLLDRVGVGITDVGSLIFQIFKHEGAVCLNECRLEQLARRIIVQANREDVVLQRLSAVVGLRPGQGKLAGLGDIDVRKLNGGIRNARNTGVYNRFGVGHVARSVVGHDDGDVVFRRRIVNSLRMGIGDILLDDEIMSAFAEGS